MDPLPRRRPSTGVGAAEGVARRAPTHVATEAASEPRTASARSVERERESCKSVDPA